MSNINIQCKKKFFLYFIIAIIFMNLLYYGSPGKNDNIPPENQDKSNIFGQSKNRVYIITEWVRVYMSGLVPVDNFMLPF